MKRLIVVLITVFLVAQQGYAKPIKKSMARKVVAEANEFTSLLVNENVKQYVEKLHPRVIQLLGGKKRIIYISKKNNHLMRQRKLKVVKYEIFEPEKIYKSKEEIFTFLKAHVVLDSPKVEISKETYIIAARNKKEDEWYFIDGSNITSFEGLGKIFPEFPKEVEIPKNTRQIIHK